MKTVLVLGGAGFIGSALIARLVSERFYVVSLDNYTSGSIDNHVSGACYIEGNASQVNELVTTDIDVVFHFAEYSRVEPSFRNQDVVFESNLNSIYSVLRFCESHNAKLIYAGSSSGFASYDKKDISPYTFIKSINVSIINQFAIWNDIDYAIVYFYNAYGEGEIGSGEYATVVEKFLQMKRQGKATADIHGTGNQTRNFTYIGDIANALMMVMEKAYGDGHGIGCDESWSVNDLCKMVGLTPNYIGNVLGNREYAPLNTEKTKKLGWQWKMSLPSYIAAKISELDK